MVGFGLFVNYATNPVESHPGSDTTGGTTTGKTDVTTDLATVDLLAAIGILRGWDFGIDLPLSAIRNVAFAKDLDQFTFGIGDVRLATKYQLLDRASRGFGLALDGEFTIPTGDTRDFLGEEGITFSLGAVSDATLGPLDAALALGYLYRDQQQGLGDAATLRAALAWPIPSVDLTPVVELRGSSTFDGFLKKEESSPIEVIAGARWVVGASWFERMGLASRGLALTAGAGFGLNAGIGSPEVRGIVGISPVIGSSAAAPAHAKLEVSGSPDVTVERETDAQAEVENDRDHDGIPDDQDVCPDLPETKNGYLDEDGCPDEIPHPAAAIRVSAVPSPSVVRPRPADSFPPIYFDSASGAIDSEGRETLQRLADALRREPQLRVRLVGHADGSGQPAANDKLSASRAEQARRMLLELSGVGASRVEAVGRGAQEPVASNATPDGRARNRRVEIELNRPE